MPAHKKEEDKKKSKNKVGVYLDDAELREAYKKARIAKAYYSNGSINFSKAFRVFMKHYNNE